MQYEKLLKYSSHNPEHLYLVHYTCPFTTCNILSCYFVMVISIQHTNTCTYTQLVEQKLYNSQQTNVLQCKECFALNSKLYFINLFYIFLRDAIFAHLIGRVRNNLHIVLCMSPVGEAFRTRCRMFPSLVNCCTIDWFTEWPR